ncbi:hypothetical protein ABT187_49230, partial [Streptomyces sp. NPDC001817]|uniref:hypothetical protein n=1 Tax=Streptomyces sp. NPDC001817 TaxID=3154398 RepID=UPI00332F2D5C
EQTTTYHYTPTGTLANDTTAGLTASYLTTPQGREHRTLTQDGIPPADDRAGTGYLHTDRRGNTLALVNHEGAVTDSYYYEDYGRPTTHHTTPLTPNPTANRAHTNPIQYGGEYTNNWDHTQYTPARTYTPDGYFTTRDTYQLHNRHQAFDTNPIEYTDPSGNKPLTLRTKHQKNRQYNEKLKAKRDEVKAEWHTARETRLKHEKAMTLFNSSATSMSESEVAEVRHLAENSDHANSMGRVLFDAMSKSTPDDGCLSLVAAFTKTCSTGALMKPSHFVNFVPSHISWPRVARGGKGDIVQYLNDAKIEKGSMYMLHMRVEGPKGSDPIGHAVTIFRSSKNGAPEFKMAQNGAYGKLDMGHWDRPGLTYKATSFVLFDMGVKKLSNEKLQDAILTPSSPAKGKLTGDL